MGGINYKTISFFLIMIKLNKNNLYFLSDEAKQIDLYDVPGPGGGKAHLNDTLDDYLMEFDGYREEKYKGMKWGYDWSLAEINKALRESSIRTIKVQFFKGVQYGALFKADGHFFIRKETVPFIDASPGHNLPKACFYKSSRFYHRGMPVYMPTNALDEDGIWTASDFIELCGDPVSAKECWKRCFGQEPEEVYQQMKVEGYFGH